MMLQGFRADDLVIVNLSLGYGATTRYARCEFWDGKSDALCLVDVTGKMLDGDIVSARLMSDSERDDWFAYDRLEAYEAAERAADPVVMARVVLVLLVAARGRVVVNTTGETVRECA